MGIGCRLIAGILPQLRDAILLIFQIYCVAHMVDRRRRVIGFFIRDGLPNGFVFLIGHSDVDLMDRVTVSNGDGVPRAGDGLTRQIWRCRLFRCFLRSNSPGIGHNPLHKGISVQLFRVHNLAVYNPSLSQGLPDSDGVHIIQIVLFNLGVETFLFDELGNPALYFGPGQSHSVGAFRADRKRGFAFASVKLMGQPCGGIFFSRMIFHVADNGVFAFDLAIPGLDSTVNVIVRKWAQQFMELGIGFVCHFPVQPLAKLRHIREQADQLYIVRVENGAAHSRITLDHSVFIITMTAGVPVSDVLGNSFQHDGLIFFMQLPESRLCRLCLLVGSLRLRLFLGKRKSRGRFHTLCFVDFMDLFRFGEEQV